MSYNVTTSKRVECRFILTPEGFYAYVVDSKSTLNIFRKNIIENLKIKEKICTK